MSYTTINKPSDYFNTKLYTGTGSAGQAQTGIGFQPDLVWTKSRDNAYPHQWYDVIRGVTKRIQSNDTSAEATQSNGLTSFDSDGFTVGDASGTGVNTATYASWNWKANGTGVANTDGSISSTVSANTTSGFSIVSYTGTGANATVGHGLGVAPSMVITKRRSSTDDWIVWNKGLTNPASYLYLNSTNAEMGSVAAYQNITPTANLLYPGTDSRTNNNGETYTSYCFADVQGYSKFGSYVGNGNADGTFVYTGFKPAFVMVKRTDSTGSWIMSDGTRDPINAVDNYLSANNSNVESDFDHADFLSNGIKFRTTNDGWNLSGGSYIFMAFAEAPLVGTNGVTAKGR